MLIRPLSALFSLVGFCSTVSAAPAVVPLSLSLELCPAAPLAAVPLDFCGLSYETRLLLPAADGSHYFDADQTELIAAFRQLGIKSLRIGGNTAEREGVPVPNEADIDALFAFARAADTKVIYTLRMDHNTPTEAARIARYIDLHYADHLQAFIVGNEPNKGGRTYAAYYGTWQRFATAINAGEAVPRAVYCAPTTTDGGPEWSARMATDEAGHHRVAMIGQHYYPGGGSPQFNDRPATARTDLMSLAWHHRYQKLHDRFVPAVRALGLGFRLNETNSFHTGGVHDASDTFAATLWGLDYLYWWAQHGALGLNFHSGQKVYPGDDVVRQNVYTPLTMNADGATVLPLGYAIKAFNLVAPGNQLRAVKLRSTGHVPRSGFVAYATVTPDGATTYLTLINGTFGDAGVSYRLNLPSAQADTVARLDLLAPAGDPSAATGLTLGDAAITPPGTWSGTWTTPSPGEAIEVAPASATLIRLSRPTPPPPAGG